MEDAIREIMECAAAVMDRLQEVLENTTSKTEAQDVEAELDEQAKTTDSHKRKLRDIITEAKVPPRQEIYKDEDDEEDDDEDKKMGRAKPDTALRPDKLSLEFTPDEFCEWQEQFSSYFEASNFEVVSVRCQQQYLKACLNSTLKLKLSEKCNKYTSVFGDCLLYTSPSPRDKRQSRMPSSA